jgi:hypothetical protein
VLRRFPVTATLIISAIVFAQRRNLRRKRRKDEQLSELRLRPALAVSFVFPIEALLGSAYHPESLCVTD